MVFCKENQRKRGIPLEEIVAQIVKELGIKLLEANLSFVNEADRFDIFESKEDICKGKRKLVGTQYFGGLYRGSEPNR
jgi:hypothetical protein